MENIDIDRIWKEARQGSDANFKLSIEEIDGFRLMRSGQIFSDIRKIIWTGLTIDIFLLIALLFYILFLNLQGKMVPVLVILLLITGMVVIYSWATLRKIKRLEVYSDTIATRFEELKSFFRLQFPLFQFVTSLSNPLLVLTGVFYYMHFKYSEVRFSDIEDIIVITVIAAISYLVGYAGNRLGSSGLGREVENLLSEEIYDDEYLADFVKRERALKRKKFIIMSVIAIAGLILLVVLILLYYKQLQA